VRWLSTPRRKRRSPPSPSAAHSDRCRNFRRQIAQIERRERESSTTGVADQLALQRHRIVEQQQRAGCC